MKNLKFAFKQTIPVLLGYIVFGTAFGLLLEKAGYGILWSLAISIVVYAGSMQFVLVGFLANPISLFSAAAMTFSVNSRHIFYGLSFIEKFRSMGKKYFYMIFSLTDETYSLLCSVKVPRELDSDKVFFSIAFLNQAYWIVGCVTGAILGGVIPFDTTGVDFAMTAMFVVIFLDQWKAAKNHAPAITGITCAAVCLFIFGADKFILPSLLAVVVILLLWKEKQKQDKRSDDNKSEVQDANDDKNINNEIDKTIQKDIKEEKV